ncbi:GNAT family N-acetyltransferase [Myroides sp. 1354]|uniref:GNAT family N-acetyltransferase n=1 Tax=unclassified Myroides TaxID=2642485 RepID=UPI002575ED54|nr:MULTISPECIES: GNAT family N-acetyltransferase [unclassified Myroides]MDM1044862.1 GNAT family N-acetyltransferase [Myroides sp. R163-1]MDM1055575.1 GNAT family N-acetyltransferase [Myroides sp. 1354]MDM1068872.1 GNAT family N-acetyltransferase [Myroides sp. 1372]
MEKSTIRPLVSSDIDQVITVLNQVKQMMFSNGIDQWDEHYPNAETIQMDLQNQQAYVYTENEAILAYMVLNEAYDIEYEALKWSTSTPFLVIHRLFVQPAAQGKGISSQMIQFAETYAKAKAYASIRFDAYALNNTANAVYLKKGYIHVGTVQFRKGVFNCYEKAI